MLSDSENNDTLTPPNIMQIAEAATSNLQPCLYAIRNHIMAWSVRRPVLAMTLVILACMVLLPLVSATALMPVIFMLNLSNFIATKGMMYVIYVVLFQGFVLGFILVLLFFGAFAIATSASVLHSHKYFYK